MSTKKQKEEKFEEEEEKEETEYEEEEKEELDEQKLNKIDGGKFDIKKCLESEFFEEGEDNILYTNLYPIEFTKDITIYQYAFQIKPECHEESVILKILRDQSSYLFKTYGYYYRSGNQFFSVKKEDKIRTFKAVIVHKGMLEYTITVQPWSIGSIIKAGKQHDFEEVQEKVLFLIIREILSANPNVHFDRDNLYLENKKEEVEGYQNSYFIHDGYKISIQQASIGICLIIGVKNKIKGKLSVLDFIDFKDKDENYKLCGRRFIPYEGSRSQVISYIDFDRNPINTNRNYKQETYKYYDYYDKIWNIKIKDKTQPLIIVDVKDPQYKEKPKCYIPELCNLLGINDEDTKDFNFMKQIIEKTRLSPDQKIEQIEKCIDLFTDTTEKKSINNDKKGENLNTIYNDENNTSKKKMEYYGIKISKIKTTIKPYYIQEPTFNNGKNKKLSIQDINRVIPVARENISTDDWICLYTIQAETISFDLLKGLLKCCKGYNLKFKNDDSNWIPMKSNNVNDWINKVESELNYRKNCKFVMFLINNKTDKLYAPLKKHSLSTSGYVSQVIKYESITRIMKKRGLDSYFSKILLQINNKLGGFNYFLNIPSFINDRKIMLVGVDSSHTWGSKTAKFNNKKTGVAMIATKDKNFSKFYSNEEIIKYDKHYCSSTRRAISAFIEQAVKRYNKENGENPKNIIIYRQGIAHNQIKKIDLEVRDIANICKELNIKYYYILVNTRGNIKFFEKNISGSKYEKGKFKNPEGGLIILNQITNIKRFEFYIQPQKVNIGSATPTYFNVAYGNMDCPPLLIQLTYWTTFIYPNWQNAVRVPHVIKLAEKLANMTAKFTHSKLNENLFDTQSFL